MVKKLNIKALKTYITKYISIFVISIVILITTIVLAIEEYRLGQKDTEYLELLNKNIDFVLDYNTNEFTNILSYIVNLDHVQQKIKTQDREGLYKILKPMWEALKQSNKKIKIFNVHLKDGSSFLRLHKPEVFGDKLSDIRPMIKHIHKEHKKIMGYETGKHSTSFRVITPLFDKKNNYLGALEIGFDPQFILDTLHKINGFYGLIFIKKQDLDLFSKPYNINIAQYCLQSEIPREISSIKEILSPSILEENLKIELNDKIYKTYIYNLKDFENNTKVKLVFLHNIPKISDFEKFLLIVLFALIILLFTLLIFFIYKKTTQYEKVINKIFYKQVRNIKEKENIMIAQSRHAAMGEMISMIAHQWRQPISIIAMEANNVLVDIELEELKEEELINSANEVLIQTQELSKTIDDFRDFFKPKKMKEEVLVQDIADEALSITDKSLQNNNIKVLTNYANHKKIKTYSRELMQVFINIIKNAKEAIVEKNISDGQINIDIFDDKNSIVIKIYDNAGGIPKEIIDDIFNPYFTTKDENTGTGLGLYISKTIIQKHLHGKISVHNKDKGACFTITLPFISKKTKHDK